MDLQKIKKKPDMKTKTIGKKTISGGWKTRMMAAPSSEQNG